jgi:hypothetical protein
MLGLTFLARICRAFTHRRRVAEQRHLCRSSATNVAGTTATAVAFSRGSVARMAKRQDLLKRLRAKEHQDRLAHRLACPQSQRGRLGGALLRTWVQGPTAFNAFFKSRSISIKSDLAARLGRAPSRQELFKQCHIEFKSLDAIEKDTFTCTAARLSTRQQMAEDALTSDTAGRGAATTSLTAALRGSCDTSAASAGDATAAAGQKPAGFKELCRMGLTRNQVRRLVERQIQTSMQHVVDDAIWKSGLVGTWGSQFRFDTRVD